MTVAELFLALGVKLNNFDEANEAIGGLRRNLAALAAVRFAENMVEGAAELGTHISSVSQALGMTVQQTQEFGNIAEKSGSTLDQFAVGMGMFERNLREYAQGRGGKAFAASMNEMRLSVQDANNLLSSPQGLGNAVDKVADRFKAMGNTAERGALARGLFGARGARAMVADLSRGSAAIHEMTDRFRELGGELDDNEVQSLKNLKATLVDVKTALGGAANKIVAALAPVLIMLANTVAKTAEVFSKVFAPIFSWIGHNSELVVAALAAVVTAFVVLKAEAFMAAAEIVAAWVVAAAPFIALAAALFLVGAVIQDVVVGFSGGHSVIFDFFSSIWEWALKSDGAIGAIARTIQKVVNAIREAVGYIVTAYDKARGLAEVVIGAADEAANTSFVGGIQDKRLSEISQKIVMYQAAERQAATTGYAFVPGGGIESREQIQQGITDLRGERQRVVNLGQEGADATPAPAAASANPWDQVISHSSVTVQPGAVVIHAGNADPKQVADWVNESLKKFARDLGGTTPGGKSRQ